jgi:glucosamine--fructose-6-phosphate aminotransferase (isomerizing)
MCGIIASIGKDNSFFHCLCGLKQLQNRGYDSAGVCSIIDDQFITTKYASTDK